MLKVENVTKYYGDLKAVDNLSFEVEDGCIFGLLGLNGAGKTTTFRMIMGLIDDYTGSITLDGKKIDYSMTDKIGFLTEERSLLTKMTVVEQVKFYAILKNMKEEDIVKRLDYYLDKFGISEYKYKKIKELSKGNQQKIQFITSIIHEPKILILDEPFSGLDPINVELFKKEILELKEKGTSIIFSSHRMEHVELFCEKLVVLVKGKTVLNGYLKDIKKEYKKKDVYIIGDVVKEDLEKIEGVVKVRKENDNYIVTISDEKYVSRLFNYVKKCDNIIRFSVEEPSLNEIFIEKVGNAYDK
ncbi:putative sodium extrusion ABC transporter ATP-binding protein NatA [Clostridium sp. CAG:762]|nr:putative sodium extrusion ABC transporter ATP-binding protein NatA [Clostridium sp. CAG:762]